MIGIGHIIAFIIGGIIFRYFEEIRKIFKYIKKDVRAIKNGS